MAEILLRVENCLKYYYWHFFEYFYGGLLVIFD